MNKILSIIIAAAAIVLLSACGSKKEVTTEAYESQPSESVFYSADGTLTMSVTEKGRNKNEAIANAMRKAAYEVTFYGVRGHGTSTSMYPIIDSPTARQTHRNYFDTFFGKGGKYEKCVKLENRGDITERQGDGFVSVTATVKVDTRKLRKYFREDNIIE